MDEFNMHIKKDRQTMLCMCKISHLSLIQYETVKKVNAAYAI